MQITQSIVKALEQSCPRKTYDEFTGNQQTTTPMLRGSYFETLCLGSGAKGVITTSLPLLRSGKKSIDQLRIERQAGRFADMYNPNHKDFCGRVIVNKQLKMVHGLYEGTLDYTTDPLILYDLKLTEDMDGYWGEVKSIDFLQQIFYQWLYTQVYDVSPEIRVLIFEYSSRLRIKELKINISENATFLALQRFNKIEEMIGEFEELSEWPRVPSLDSCSKCSVVCDKRMIKESIIFEEIYV